MSKKEGISLYRSKESKNPAIIEKIAKKEKLYLSSWEQQEADPKLDQLANDLLKYGGILKLVEDNAESIMNEYGSFDKIPRSKFQKFEEEHGYNPVLIKKVFAKFLLKQKEKETLH